MKKIIIFLVMFILAVSFVTAYGIFEPRNPPKECFCTEPVPDNETGDFMPCGCPGDYEKVFIDIKPGYCPNIYSTYCPNCLTIAIVGTEDLDVRDIRPWTIKLTRDGVDTFVKPIDIDLEYVAKPFFGDLCGCEYYIPNLVNTDTYEDLLLTFNTDDLINDLDVNDILGETVTYSVKAKLSDGTKIMGKDCATSVLAMTKIKARRPGRVFSFFS